MPVDWTLDAELNENGESPRVLITYDDLPAGKNAVQMLNKVFQQCDEIEEVQPIVWKFDLLEDPEWSSTAFEDAMKADILVIAASQRLSAAVQQWIEDYCEKRTGTATAIVALFRSPENRHSQNEIEFLERAARDAGIDLFTSKNQFTYFEQAPRRDALLANVFACVEASPVGANRSGDLNMQRHWGINE